MDALNDESAGLGGPADSKKVWNNANSKLTTGDEACQEKPRSSQKGWIAVHRKILDSRVFKNEGLLKVWLWCLLRARHSPGWVDMEIGRTETEVYLQPGQLIFGRHSAAKQLRMNPSTIWKRMKKLESMQNLTIESNSHYSIITIVNWHAYQDKQEKSNSESDNRVTAGEQPGNTNNKGSNKGNNEQQLPPESSRDSLNLKSNSPQTAMEKPNWMTESDWNRIKPGVSVEAWSYIVLAGDKMAANGGFRKSRGSWEKKLVEDAQAGKLDLVDLHDLIMERKKKIQADYFDMIRCAWDEAEAKEKYDEVDGLADFARVELPVDDGAFVEMDKNDFIFSLRQRFPGLNEEIEKQQNREQVRRAVERNQADTGRTLAEVCRAIIIDKEELPAFQTDDGRVAVFDRSSGLWETLCGLYPETAAPIVEEAEKKTQEIFERITGRKNNNSVTENQPKSAP